MGLVAVAAAPELGSTDVRHAWAFMLVVGCPIALLALLAIGRLVREVPYRWLVVAALVGAGPSLAIVQALGSLLALPDSLSAEARLAALALLPALLEETVKAAGIALCLLALGLGPITRRHGKAIGAAVGVGFTLSEMAVYAGASVAGDAVISVWGQLVLRMGLLGLTSHALFSALAGVGVADALAATGSAAGIRLLRLLPWLALAVVAHALANSVGVALLATLAELMLAGWPPRPSAELPLEIVWVSMVATTTATQGWAAVVLWRWGRSVPTPVADGSAPGPDRPVFADG